MSGVPLLTGLEPRPSYPAPSKGGRGGLTPPECVDIIESAGNRLDALDVLTPTSQRIPDGTRTVRRDSATARPPELRPLDDLDAGRIASVRASLGRTRGQPQS